MSTTSTTFLLQPKAPLVFRSGKPFGAGSRDGANFPWPSAWAGLVRTCAMEAFGWRPGLDPQQQADLLQLAAAGPFLARRDAKGGLSPYLPKPSDAVRLQGADSDRVQRLAPARQPDGVGNDLPDGLLPLAFVEGKPKGKPKPGASHWTLERWVNWALTGIDATPEDDVDDWHRIASRTHVAIAPDTLAAEDGKLFQTEGWDFAPRRNDGPDGATFSDHEWVFLGRGPVVAAKPPQRLVNFGGERRLSLLSTLQGGDPLACPQDLRRALDGATRFALTLATPGLFGGGWRPGWLDVQLQGWLPGHPGTRVQLKAAQVERWQPISGWDLHAGGPKPTRRAVGAGATYWFELIAGPPLDASALWLSSICEHEQDARDGFGLALPRPWL